MPPTKGVTSLRNSSLNSMEQMVFEFVLKTAKSIMSVEAHTRQEVEFRSTAINDIVEKFRDHLFSHIVWSNYEEVSLRILKAIEAAAVIKRKEWKRCVERKSYLVSNQMLVISSLVEIIASPFLRSLNLDDVPSTSKIRIIEILHKFKGIRMLNLGSSSDGIMEFHKERIQNGLKKLTFLTSFSMCFNCNDSIIKTIHRNCRNLLRILDIEMSKGVTDQSANLISECVNIEKLHIFHTSLSPSGHAIVLKGLQRLRILVRGDFLCEALEHLETSGKLPILALEEFWSSEEYFFHSAHQMDLVQQTCPRMRKVMYQFNLEKMPDLLFLTDFTALNELHLWGSGFYSEKLNLVLNQIGPQLKILFLIHVDNIDKRALIIISQTCVHLSTLGFYNCEFTEAPNEIPFYVDNFDIIRMHRKQEMIELLLEVQNLHIVSQVSSEYLIQILSSVLNVESINIGMNCEITDYVISEVIVNNKLQHLQTLKISQSCLVTKDSLNLLLSTCENLRMIGDLENWTGLKEGEVASFRKWIKNCNYELDTEERNSNELEEKETNYIDTLPPDVLNYVLQNLRD